MSISKDYKLSFVLILQNTRPFRSTLEGKQRGSVYSRWLVVSEGILLEGEHYHKNGLEKIPSNGPLMIWPTNGRKRWVNCYWSSRYGMVKQNGKIQIIWEKRKSFSRKKNKQHLFVELFTMSSTKQSLKKNNQKARHKTNQVSFSLYTEIVCFAQQ